MPFPWFILFADEGGVPVPYSKDSHASEFLFWQHRENALLRSAAGVGEYTDHALSWENGATKWRAVNWKEAAASAGAYTSADQVVLVPDPVLPLGVKPKAGDKIVRTAQGDAPAFTVLEVTVGKFGLTHRCVCRNLVLVGGLSGTGTLSRPTAAKDAAGRPALSAYTVVAEDVPCRVQPEDAAAADVFDRVTAPRRFTAYLAETLPARAKDVFTSDGLRYTVLSSRNPQRLGDLFALDLERIP